MANTTGIVQAAASTELWSAPYADHSIAATVNIPGSKSLSNRYLILAALGQRPTVIHGLLRSRDTELMMQALQALGVRCVPDDADPTTVRVTPPCNGRFSGNTAINCGLAGTVMRFVPALALLADGPVRFDGDEQAYARPMLPLLEGLEQLGAVIAYHGQPGHLPFTVTRGAGPDDVLRTHRLETVRIDSSASSQFISGLLLLASRLPTGLQLIHIGRSLPSMPHIEMTMHDIALSGGEVTMSKAGQWTVPHRDLQLPQDILVEPDLSNAVPFLGAAMIAGGTVSVPHWPEHTTQPGGLVPRILMDMGADVVLDAGELKVSGDQALHGLGEYDLSAAGEIAPSIAALAVLADAPSTLCGIGHLRGHETNRLAALVEQIRNLGADAEELPDALVIRPVARDQLHGRVMQTYADHRMATFAAMIGLAVRGITVVDIATTRKTLPDFPGMWQAMLGTDAA